MKNNKKLIITLTIVGVLLVSLGTTYALLIGWSSRISKNSSLVVGDIYMHYNEGNKQIYITDAMPSDTYSNDYFEFTIDGKNTSNNTVKITNYFEFEFENVLHDIFLIADFNEDTYLLKIGEKKEEN